MWVVIPAAGIGARMQNERPKQYLSLLGSSILEHTLRRLAKNPAVTGLMVGLSSHDTHFSSINLSFTDKAIQTFVGGESRAETVRNGLHALSARYASLQDTSSQTIVDDNQSTNPSLVAIHDAVRPFFEPMIFTRLALMASNYGGAIAAMPISDTVKSAIVESGIQYSEGTLDRDKLWQAQTPQVFQYDILRSAYDAAYAAGQLGAITDEASVVERYTDVRPVLVESSMRNIKLTRPDDMLLGAYILQQMIEDNDDQL